MGMGRVMCGAALVISAAMTTNAAGQRIRSAPVATTQTYTIPGPQIWSEAKKYGFLFRPLATGTGQTVTQPWDGLNTQLRTVLRDPFGRPVPTVLAQVVGGNGSVNRPTNGTRRVTFEFFGGPSLAAGWSVVRVEMGGNFAWDRQPLTGSEDPSFTVKATSTTSVTGSAILRSVTLQGPAGARWADAFVGRKLFTMSGIAAWSVARSYGFEFGPTLDALAPTWQFPRVVGALDGLQTILTADFSRTIDLLTCPRAPYPGNLCIIAQVAGGAMSVRPPYGGQPRQRVRFVMFSGKRLAPGWIVREVRTSGTVVQAAPEGGNDLGFVVELTSAAGRAATASVASIALEGPATASSWREAFERSISAPGRVGGTNSVPPPPPPVKR